MAVVSKALVIGGGIGGLTAAIALRQQGIAVDLVEVAPNLSVYGVGIIQPNNALRAFDRVGLAQACIEAGAAFPGWKICSSRGDVLMDAPSPTSAAPHLPAVNGITRPRLHKILTEAAYDSGAVIHLGETVSALVEGDGAVAVTFRGGRRANYDLVIAADGLLSDMRRRYFPQVGGPQFTGQGVWRYNLPRPADMEWGSIHFGADSKVGLVPLSPDTMYMFVVTAEPGNPWYQGEGLAQIMRSRLSDYEGPIAELARQITDPAGVVYKPMHNVLMPGPWNSGRVVFIGDAAHATTPHLAQGAAMAVEDAVLLAGLLGEGEDIAQVLAHYVHRRLPRARYVVDVSTQLADWELEAWGGVHNPKADPGHLLHEATVKLMDDF